MLSLCPRLCPVEVPFPAGGDEMEWVTANTLRSGYIVMISEKRLTGCERSQTVTCTT